MRLLSLALVSALALTSACQKAASPDIDVAALPQIDVPATSLTKNGIGLASCHT